MKQYAAYKPSGVAWLGDVPDHWEVIKLTRLFGRIGSGTTPGTNNLEYYNGTIPWVTTAELRETVILDTKQKVTLTALAEHSALKLYRAGSVVIAMYGATIGRLGILGIDATLNQACCVFENPTGISSKFFYYWLWAERPTLLGLSAGGGQPNLNQDLLRQLKMPVPPLPEQRAIAAFLDERTAHLDGLIQRKEELLKLLAEQRAALITRAVTRGLDAAAPLQESGVPWLGQVPTHWLITRLKFVADVHSGIAKGKKYLPTQELVEVPYLRVANVQDGYLKLDDITTISVTPAEAKSYELQPQDILMNEGGDNDKLGRGTVWEGQVVPCIHQNHVFAIRHHGKVDSWFLSYFFGSTACKTYFLLTGNQATNLASISASAISDTPLALPPLAEQHEIVVAINQGNERLDKMTDITTREITKLREYRAALITAAVTGRIDVRAGVAAAEPELAEAL